MDGTQNKGDEPMSSDVVVSLQDLHKSFGTNHVLRGIDLEVTRGEVVCIIGPSGSGKTTLLTLIGALRAMQEGSCQVLGQELFGASERARVSLRQRIGFIFQNHNLLGALTARQNVAMALEVTAHYPETERLARAGEMLAAVGLAPGSRPTANPKRWPSKPACRRRCAGLWCAGMSDRRRPKGFLTPDCGTCSLIR